MLPRGRVAISYTLLMCGGVGYVFFAWSTRYIDIAVSSSLYELWPIAWLVAFQYIDRTNRRVGEYRIVPFVNIILMILGAGPLALVILSTASRASSGHGLALPVFGIVLGTVAPMIAALTAFSFAFVNDLVPGKSRNPSDDWNLLPSSVFEQRRFEESVLHGVVVLSRIGLIPVVIAIAIIDVGLRAAIFSRSFAGGILVGLLLFGPAGYIIRKAHVISARREIISLQYVSPILALVWLALVTDIDIARKDFLIFGTVSIVALNMLINADPERKRKKGETDRREYIQRDSGRIQERYSLKALVVALLGFGMFIYFRDGVFVVDDLLWSENGSYWAVVGLASTVFALLLAFRLTRVEALLVAEDYRTLGLVRRIEIFPREMFGTEESISGKPSLLMLVRQLNRSNTLDEYRRSYTQANAILQDMVNRIISNELHASAEQRNEIAQIRTELDALAHGRQQAREFAERIALWLIGTTIMAFCLALPPESSGWSRLLSETFAVMLASIVVYLLFHLADMRRSRADELLTDKNVSEAVASERDLYVRFRDEKDARWQRIFAGLIILGVVGTVVGLLAWSRLMPA